MVKSNISATQYFNAEPTLKILISVP